MFAVLPQVLPHFTAFSLYRWDINVRMSTVIGLVGGGGIGFLLIQWIRQVQYEHAGLAVWLIAITVSTLDFISASEHCLLPGGNKSMQRRRSRRCIDYLSTCGPRPG